MSRETITPKPADFNPASTLGGFRMVRNLYGVEGSHMLADTIRGRAASEDTQAGVDAGFYKNLTRVFGKEQTPEAIYRLNMERANDTMRSLEATAFPSSNDRFGLSSRAVALSKSPAIRLKMLTDGTIDPVVRFELRRQLLLASICARLDHRDADNELNSILSGFQDVVDRELLNGGLAGNMKAVTALSVHDAQNAVVDVFVGAGMTRVPEQPEGLHVKERQLKVRRTKDGTIIRTDIRKKPMESSVLKAIKKAILYDEAIDPYASVNDSLGLQFVVFGDLMKRDEFAQQTVELLAGHRDLDVVRIVHRPHEPGKNGKNPSTAGCHSMNRFELYVNGSGVPVEVIFKTHKEFYTDEYHVGEFDDEGLPSGSAHSLMEHRRVLPLLPVIYPTDLYGADPVAVSKDYLREKAQALLLQDRVSV